MKPTVSIGSESPTMRVSSVNVALAGWQYNQTNFQYNQPNYTYNGYIAYSSDIPRARIKDIKMSVNIK